MTNTEFKTKLAEAFKTHMFMDDRDYHTVNELLYVLEHDTRFGKEDFNISIKTIDNNWWSIPTLEAFVDVKTRGFGLMMQILSLKLKSVKKKSLIALQLMRNKEE